MKQEHKVESLNNCVNELQQQAHAQRLELQDAHHGYVESRREQVRLQEELSVKEKSLRDTQIRSMHEMGEIKRAQELRVDEFSVQKLRESHDTIQRLTSQIQAVQERMNPVNDSREYQEVESNHSGCLTFRVNQQRFQVLDTKCYSRDKRLPLDTWKPSGPQEIFFCQSTFKSSQTPSQGILHSPTPSATGAVPVHVCTGTLVARGEGRMGSTIPMPEFAGRP